VNEDERFLAAAIKEAMTSREAGGIPIGAVLVCDGEIIATGHNRRVQDGSAIHHAEMNCIENAGRIAPDRYARSTLYTTLSPCYMCAGAVVLFGIKRIVAGENRTVGMAESFLAEHNVDLTVMDNPECFDMLQSFIKANPAVWHEDKGDN
jgi:cytosine deaminase